MNEKAENLVYERGLTSTERQRWGSVYPFILLCWAAPTVCAVLPLGERKQELFSSHCLSLAEGSSGLGRGGHCTCEKEEK